MSKPAGKQPRFSRTTIFILLILLALLTAWFTGVYRPELEVKSKKDEAGYQSLGYLPVAVAFQDQLQDVLVEGSGTVVKVLPDDTKGSRHQRLILQIDTGPTVLIAHNIDLAPRIPNIDKGDSLSFRGSYVYNEKGGIVHWTHHDPQGRHPAGWLIHNGATYD